MSCRKFASMRSADDKDRRRARPGLWSATLRAKACVAAMAAVWKSGRDESVSTRTQPTQEFKSRAEGKGAAIKELRRGHTPP